MKDFVTKGTKLTKFLLAGVPSFLLAIPLNIFLVETVHLFKPLSYAIILIIQVSINFFMCRKFVFQDHNEVSIVKQFFQFILGILTFRVIDWTLYSIAVELLEFHYILCQITNTLLLAIAKYKFSKRVIEK